MGLFNRFEDVECRAWIDAILAMVRMPSIERLWVG